MKPPPRPAASMAARLAFADSSAVMNYGMCLRRLGEKEMANQVFERARKLMK